MKKFFRLAVLIISLLYISNIKAQSYSIETVPDIKKEGMFYVANPDNILSKDTENTLNSLLRDLEQQTSVEVDVVVLNKVNSVDLDGFANELFNYWGTGKKDKDNGLLILFVLDERFLRFETGYGLEGVLTDVNCKRIQSKLMFPEFRKGNYDEGMLIGVHQIINYFTKPEVVDEIYSTAGSPSFAKNIFDCITENSFNIFLLCYVLITILLTISFIRKIYYSLHPKGESNYDYYIQLRPYTKSIGCFLFIFPFTLVPIWFWLQRKLKKLRNTPIRCTKCNNLMHLLTAKEEFEFLNTQQKLEQKIKLIDYDIWKCDVCNYTHILSYNNTLTTYTICRTILVF